MIDILVLSKGQFRATFSIWQWVINQTSPLLGCSPWKITFKALEGVYITKKGFVCLQDI